MKAYKKENIREHKKTLRKHIKSRPKQTPRLRKKGSQLSVLMHPGHCGGDFS